MYCSICNKLLGYKRKDRPQKMCKSCAKTHYKPDTNQFTYCVDCGVKIGYKSASRPAKRCWNCYITNRRNNGKRKISLDCSIRSGGVVYNNDDHHKQGGQTL